MQKGRKLKMYKKLLIIFSFFLLFSTNTFAKMNYLKCTEKIDKVRDHWLNEGDIDSIALMEYEDTKNTIKINMVFNLSKEKPFLHIKKRKLRDYLMNVASPFSCDLAPLKGRGGCAATRS